MDQQGFKSSFLNFSLSTWRLVWFFHTLPLCLWVYCHKHWHLFWLCNRLMFWDNIMNFCELIFKTTWLISICCSNNPNGIHFNTNFYTFSNLSCSTIVSKVIKNINVSLIILMMFQHIAELDSSYKLHPWLFSKTKYPLFRPPMAKSFCIFLRRKNNIK